MSELICDGNLLELLQDQQQQVQAQQQAQQQQVQAQQLQIDDRVDE